MGFRFAAFAGLMLLQFSSPLCAQTEWLEVVSIVPSMKIDHEVEIRGKFDEEKHEIPLRGPQFLSMAVGCNDKPVQKETYLTWFQIPPTPVPNPNLWVSDPWDADQKLQLNLGNSMFLLFPAQRITTGAPSDLPDGLSCFQAFKIKNGAKIAKKVELTGSLGKGERTIKELMFICFPAEQWHHADHTPVTNWNQCLLVFRLESQPVNKDFSTIDAFGLNKLTANSSDWLCVPTAIVTNVDKDKSK